jgi:hypothetical protein
LLFIASIPTFILDAVFFIILRLDVICLYLFIDL